MSDFAFLNREVPKRTRAQHIEDVRREFLKLNLKRFTNEAEKLQERFRDLIASGADVTDELNELDTTANGLMLVLALLRKSANDKKTETTQPFWTAAE